MTSGRASGCRKGPPPSDLPRFAAQRPCVACQLDAMDQKTKNRAVRCFLLGAIGRDDDHLPRYTEITRLFGGIPLGVRNLLDPVAEECAQHTPEFPDITVLAVASDGFPGTFKHFGKVKRGDESEAAWRAELQRVREFSWPAVWSW